MEQINDLIAQINKNSRTPLDTDHIQKTAKRLFPKCIINQDNLYCILTKLTKSITNYSNIELALTTIIISYFQPFEMLD